MPIFSKKYADDTNSKGIGWVLASCFLIGDVAGAGLMALPIAMVQGGVVFGTITSLICCICAAYSAGLLGENLMIMRRRWPEYKEHNGKPYMEMARRSLGRTGEKVLQVMVYCTAAGTVIVFLLLAANNISTFLNGNFGIHMHKCITLIIVGLALWPLCMPRSPMDFGWVAVFATLSTSVAVCVILMGTVHDASGCTAQADYTTPQSVESMALAFGTIMFSYGGHVAFPTIQMDMRRPAEFAKSAYVSFAFLFIVMYAPVSLIGYHVYGNSMADTIITSLQVNWMQQSVSVMMTVHAMTSYIILLSPVAQGIEHRFDTPQKFSAKRFVIRSALLWFTVFVALSVPRFGVILDLVGGSFVTCIGIIWPGLFNLLLKAGERKSREKSALKCDDQYAGVADIFKYNSTKKIFVVSLVIFIGICGGISATVTAFKELLGAEMETPCYLRIFSPSGFSMDNEGGSVNCCGFGKNVSVWPDVDVSAYCARN